MEWAGSNEPPTDIWGRPRQVVGHDSHREADLQRPASAPRQDPVRWSARPSRASEAREYRVHQSEAASGDRRDGEGHRHSRPTASVPPTAAPGQASANPYAVVHRLLAIQQAKSMHYGKFHAWTTTAMKYGVPTPELIAAALATKTTAEPWAVEALAKKIQRGLGREATRSIPLERYPNPDAGAIRSIYKAANAENYVPEYRTASQPSVPPCLLRGGCPTERGGCVGPLIRRFPSALLRLGREAKPPVEGESRISQVLTGKRCGSV